MASVKDPVCGMNVDPDTATDRTTYKGINYYFCSADCRRQFEVRPEQFTTTRVAESAWTGKHRSAGKPHGFIGPKFGSAGSGGLEYESGPEGDEGHPVR